MEGEEPQKFREQKNNSRPSMGDGIFSLGGMEQVSKASSAGTRMEAVIIGLELTIQFILEKSIGPIEDMMFVTAEFMGEKK
ncbi:hypothetical protein PIB30_078193 [Stylosanthes scabra]|uniref:Uncharacterized protein n=1 Tax=Stylosanthes scabra TaxID=79078 RepID=A0ABU6TQC4_9FABA|nr:hypothetical protein [Stylosanthes scabra]